MFTRLVNLSTNQKQAKLIRKRNRISKDRKLKRTWKQNKNINKRGLF